MKKILTITFIVLLMLRGFICEANEERLIYFIQYGTSISSVEFSQDGRNFLVGSDGLPAIWDTNTREMLSRFVFPHWYEQAIFSPDEKYIAVLNSYQYHNWKPPKRDNIVAIFDVNTQAKVHEWDEGGDAGLEAIAFSPDGTKLLIGGGQGIKLYDIATEQKILSFSGNLGYVKSLAFSPDGKSVVSGSSMSDGSLPVQVWNASDGIEVLNMGKSMKSEEFPGYAAANSVTFSPNGTNIFAGGESPNIAVLFNAITGEELAVFSGHSNWIYSVALSPDGTLALTGGLDGTAKVWDISTGETLVTLRGNGGAVKSVAFSPDGTKALTGDKSGNVYLWDISDLTSPVVPTPTPTPTAGQAITPIPTPTQTPTPVVVPIQTLTPPIPKELVEVYRNEFEYGSLEENGVVGVVSGPGFEQAEAEIVNFYHSSVAKLADAPMTSNNFALRISVADQNTASIYLLALEAPIVVEEDEEIYLNVHCVVEGSLHLDVGFLDHDGMMVITTLSHVSKNLSDGSYTIRALRQPDTEKVVIFVQVVGTDNAPSAIYVDGITAEVM